jgi:biopolymer transport protein TolR
MLLRKGKEVLAPPAVQSNINVTPLVDVCLVLLIIFMVVTPMLQKGVDVALPETEDPAKMPETQKQLTISIKQDGTVYVKDNWVTDDQLPQTLKQIHDESPEKTVVVKGDRRLKYKEVRKLMQTINEAGFGRVGLELKKKEKGA